MSLKPDKISFKSAKVPIMGKRDLDLFLFKLIKYYNSICTIRKENYDLTENLNETITKYEKLIERASSSDVQNELEKKQMTNKEREEYIKKIETMKRNLSDLIRNNTDSHDSTNSLKSMIENEKTNFQRDTDKIIDIEAKLHSMDVCQINYQANNLTLKLKTRNVKEINSDLKREVKSLNEIFIVQNNTLSKLSETLYTKNSENMKKKFNYEKCSQEKEKRINVEKTNLIQKLKETEVSNNQKKEKESIYIKLILGLDLISNYFIKEAKDKMKDSDEYFLFKGKQYQICESPELLDRGFSAHTLNKNEMKTIKISLEYLKEKYINLNISHEDLLKLVSQLLNKKTFYHEFMNKYNMKQINLETKRDKNIEKVKNILMKTKISQKELPIINERLRIYLPDYETTKFNNKKNDDIVPFFFINSKSSDFYNKICLLFDDIKSNFFSTLLIFQENLNESDYLLKYQILRSELDNLNKIDCLEKGSNSEFFRKVMNDYKSISISKNEFKAKECKDLEDIVNEQAINLISNLDIASTIATHSNPLSRMQTRNISSEERLLTTNDFKHSRKSIYKGGFELITTMTSINKKEKSKSSDSMEDYYIKEKEGSNKKSVFNLRTRNLIKSNGFLQRLSKNTELKTYNKIIYEKMGVIKEITRQNKHEIYLLSKKKKEVEKISNNLILYNNPSINLNNLNSNTYNSFVKYIIDKQIKSQNESKSTNFRTPKLIKNIKKTSRVATSHI